MIQLIHNYAYIKVRHVGIRFTPEKLDMEIEEIYGKQNFREIQF